jgi:hypothetical protein
MILYMFRASLCSSSGGQLYIYSIWYRHNLYAAIQCTDQERMRWTCHSGEAWRIMVRWVVDWLRGREMNGNAISGSDGKLLQVSMDLAFFTLAYGFKWQWIPMALFLWNCNRMFDICIIYRSAIWFTINHSFIQYSVWRQVQRLFQNGSSI